jgi:hypothetical protein
LLNCSKNVKINGKNERSPKYAANLAYF